MKYRVMLSGSIIADLGEIKSRLQASGIFLLWALAFVGGVLREIKLEKEDRTKKEPIQTSRDNARDVT